MVIQDTQRGRHRQYDEEQNPVVPDHQQRRDEHLPGLHGGDEKHVLPADPHRFRVRRIAADDAPDFRPIVKAHRHPYQMLEDVAPQILDDRLAQFQRQPLAEVEAELRHGGEHEKPDRSPHHATRVMARNRPVDDRAHRPRQHRQLDRPNDDQREQPVAFARVRLRIAEHAPDQRQFQRSLADLVFIIRLAPNVRDRDCWFCRHGDVVAARPYSANWTSAVRR